MLARSSPRHFVACHVLHRLLAPRHPPRALCSLTSLNNSPNRGCQGETYRDISPCRSTAEIEDLNSIYRSCHSLGKVRSVGTDLAEPPKWSGSSVPLVGDLEPIGSSPLIRGLPGGRHTMTARGISSRQWTA